MDKPCRLCGSTGLTCVGLIKNYSLLKCHKCGLQFLTPFPDEKSLREIYSNYYKAWDIGRNSREVSSMKRDTFRGYFDPLLQHVSSGTLLDIGCATGELMELAKEMGFDVYGVEISPEGSNICNKKFGEDRIIKSSLKAGDFPSGFFDVITLCDVLEHITEPKVFLEIINDILKPNGLLMIVTPDTSSWTCKIMGMRWPHYKEEHVCYYNQSNLVKLFSPNFNIVTLKKAYKRLTLNYVAHILQTYSHSRVLKATAFMSQKLSVVIRSHHFNVHIGESYALFRKKNIEC